MRIIRIGIMVACLSLALPAQAEELFNPTLRNLTVAEWQKVADTYCHFNWSDPAMQRACLDEAAVDPGLVSEVPPELMRVLLENTTQDGVLETGAWPADELPAIKAELSWLGLERGTKEIVFKRNMGEHGRAFNLVEVRPCADLRDNQGSSFYIVTVEW